MSSSARATRRRELPADVDWFSQRVTHDPYPVFAMWRDEAPIWWSADLGGWVVSRYDDVKRVLSEAETFVQSEFFEAALVDVFQRPTMLSINPPEHTDLRRHVVKYFRPGVLQQRMGAAIDSAIDDLLREVSPGQRVELNSGLSSRLVMRVMSQLMGTREDAAMKSLYEACMAYLKKARTSHADPALRQQGKDAGIELMAYLRKLRAEKLIVPGDDLLSELAPIDFEADALLCMCAVVLIGGVETTVRGIANSMYALLTACPDGMASIRAGTTPGVNAFEEGLRWIAPLSLKARQVGQETSMHGVDLEVGDAVYTSVGAANRDPRHYDNPDDFVLDRRNRDHLSFGSGPHFCIGAPLARIEGGTFIDELLARFPDLALDESRPIVFDGPVYRSPSQLWLGL